jgi:putative NIF3 family GTP cyclohydrolase 1 type 2
VQDHINGKVGEAVKYIKDETEREILKENFDTKNNSFYIKFLKYNAYLTINEKNIELVDSTFKKTNKWILEKANNNGKEFIKVSRFLKNKKFYYKNIENGEIFTNYYLGWGYENIISN